MGTKSDIAEVLSSCRWADEGSYLGEIVKSAATKIQNNGGDPSPPPMCCLVKVIRGQYQNIGHPSFSNPSLISHLLLISAGKQSAIAAQCVKFKTQTSQRVAVPFGPTLAIPAGYQGHFEILSEDGRSVPVISSVEGLARKFPDSCLVREAIKGYKADTPTATTRNHIIAQTNSNTKSSSSSNESKSSSAASPVSPPIVGIPEITPYYRISDKNRTIHTGEVLTLVGEVTVPSASGKKVTRYLRCFDSRGQSVYLNTAQKGKFSPLARQDSISGVHTTKNLLNKRMPMMVRLVDGKPPGISNKNHTSLKKWVPELRLFSTIHEELIFGLPLSQNSKEPPQILPLPLTAPLKFQICCNFAQVEQMKEFCRLYEKMKCMMDVAKNLIQIYDINLKRELRFDGRQWKAYSPPIFFNNSTVTAADIIHNNALASSPSASSTPNGEVGDLISSNPNAKDNTNHANSSNCSNYDVPELQDYEDIDQIYDYVRGVKPIPKSSHVQHYHPKIQHPTTQVLITQVTSSHKQRLSRTTAAGVVEKKLARQNVRHYMEQRRIESYVCSPSPSPSPTKSNPTASGVISKDDRPLQVQQQQRQPLKPPRKLNSSSRQLNAMRRARSEDRLLDIDVIRDARDERPPEPPPIETIPTHKNKLTQNSAACNNKNHSQRQRLPAETKSDDDDDEVDDGFNTNYCDDEEYFSSEGDEDEYDGLKVTTRHTKANYYEVTRRNRNVTTTTTTTTAAATVISSKEQRQKIRNPLNFNHHRLTTSRQTASVSSLDNHYQEINQPEEDANENESDEQRRKLLQKQRNTTKVLISCESSPNNTSSTNTTSSSGVSSSGVGGVGAVICIKTTPDHHMTNTNIFDDDGLNNSNDSKVKVKRQHYIKRNSQNGSAAVININRPPPSPSATAGATTPTPSAAGLITGSPSNRLLFRRSPIFDCRYKSMNDLARGSLDSNASGSSSSGGGDHSRRAGGFVGLGAKLSRYFQFSHQAIPQQQPSSSYHQLCGSHSHNNNTSSSSNSKASGSNRQFGSSSSGYLSRGSPHYHSSSNINVNLLNLNIKASTRHKALFRPKSLSNLVDLTPASVRGGFGKLGGIGAGGAGGAGGKSSCRKKLLDSSMMSSQQHRALHSSTPSLDILQKLTDLTSGTSSKPHSYCSSGGGSRKNSHLPSLYL